MTTIKTSDLIDLALDWAAAKCEGVEFQSFLWAENQRAVDGEMHFFNYSTNWLSGGPIIEREAIRLIPDEYTSTWTAYTVTDCIPFECEGRTPLIAAMRCFVASRLGDEVAVPDELA